MSNFDKDRYASLIAATQLNVEYWRGHINDNSRFQRTATWHLRFGARSKFIPRGNIVALCAPSNGEDGSQFVAQDPIVDPSTAFSVEVLCRPIGAVAGVTGGLVRQYNATGGFALIHDIPAANIGGLYCYDGAGLCYYVTIPWTWGLVMRHLVFMSDRASGTQRAWSNGIPVTPTVTNTRAPVSSGVCDIFTHEQNGGWSLHDTAHVRAWNKALTNADVSAIYGAAKSLTGGEV